MSKISYDDYLGHDPFFSPCIHCGCSEFHMDWDEMIYKCSDCQDEMIYKCSDCQKPIESENNNYGKEKRPKEGVKKFKGEE
jgi:predicted RNA-binding Zn-ribbon protein involved in translation (DUF1610 family)